jgi:cytochrome c oxidase subunit 2
MPIAASEGAAEIDSVFDFMMTIATGLFLLVEGILIYCLFKFRRRKGDQTDGPAIEGNVPLEIVWTAIPTIIVFILALYSFEVYNKIGGLDPLTSKGEIPQGEMVAFNPHQNHLALGIGNSGETTGEKPIQVEVNGIQYAWIFTYPDTGIVSGELHAPVNKPVQLNIKAGDVIHAFWIPQLRLKQDAIPGVKSNLVFTANRTGDYPIICAELCGAYHGGMKSVLHVDSEEDYQKWIQDNTFANTNNFEETVAMISSQQDPSTLHSEHLGVDEHLLAQLRLKSELPTPSSELF